MEQHWSSVLSSVKQSHEFTTLLEKLSNLSKTTVIYPKKQDIFKAFTLTPFSEIKVVILGQDPYHGPGQAEGLSFSVPKNSPIPPSLHNIFKELSADLSVTLPLHGSLHSWAQQGVFLLNSILTVEAHKAGSHSHIGWEYFTDEVIHQISLNKEHVVFILWGNYARKKKSLIDKTKHLIIESAHPSPLSAHRGFFGSKPFSKTNNFLIQHNLTPIDWSIEQ